MKEMALVLLTLYLLVESTISDASGLLKHETACGKYHISNSNDPSHELFSIDEKLVDRYLFCRAMHNFHERRCYVPENVRNKYCQSLGTIKFQFFEVSPLPISYLYSIDVYSHLDFILYNYILYPCILQRNCLCFLGENPFAMLLEKEIVELVLIKRLWGRMKMIILYYNPKC